MSDAGGGARTTDRERLAIDRDLDTAIRDAVPDDRRFSARKQRAHGFPRADRDAAAIDRRAATNDRRAGSGAREAAARSGK